MMKLFGYLIACISDSICLIVFYEISYILFLWQSFIELKHKLLCTIFELESTKTEAKEEMMRSEENIKQLLQLLKMAYMERDEARGQLQSLLNNGSPSALIKNHPMLPHAQPVSLPPEITKANSCFKKFDDLSGSYSYCPSPLDCLLDAILPTRLSLPTEMADSSTLGASEQSVDIVSAEAGMIDRASTVIDKLVKRKPLPQKGGFLKAVMEAGPLLQTLLLAGPIPRWQNPPPMQNRQIPVIPIPIKEGAACLLDHKSTVNSNCTAPITVNTSYLEISHGYFQNSSSSVSSSVHGSGSFLNRECPSSAATDSGFIRNHIPTGKRRRP